MSDQLDKLRKVKVPLWAKIMGAIRGRWNARKARKKAYFVTTIYSWWWMKDKYWAYIGYLCYERGNGVRYYKAIGQNVDVSEKENSLVYGSTIAPWLAGAMPNDELVKRASNTWSRPAIPSVAKDS